jgi:hypothetical protein
MIPAELLYDLEACDDVVGTMLALHSWKYRPMATRGDPPRTRTEAGAVLWDACFATVPGFDLDANEAQANARCAQWEAIDRSRRMRGSAWRPDLRDSRTLRSRAEAASMTVFCSRIYRMIGNYLPECPAFVLPRFLPPPPRESVPPPAIGDTRVGAGVLHVFTAAGWRIVGMPGA